MTGALRPRVSAPPGTAAPPTATASPPLPGYLVDATERHIRVRVTDGTWTFRWADVLALTDCEFGAQGPRLGDARPVLVRVRAGATADFTQRRRIELTERPLTLPQDHTPTRGDDELARLTESWARRLELTTGPGIGGATMTCCQTRSHSGSDDGAACDSLD
ncbi:Uncharacterised protein [Nocardia otitidiscaviarum]|uniref:Uncharacterized protein n=1 Tax=Nocardia otitidiscaviarum TaxID=1823 RepID=A0A379JLL6_9NOCA|nr:hypothetical protein [Nocardia otitidiscaviarum]MBF6182308.1 hypothetical protein [Nocardia otitidiscaviarum]MBF6237635.1 hypothetical protein [Nocardia otitidiscaviarum]MCP9624725.1 hypothetical protein [Nocardia otitidiscaviarum]SUD49340.1 Uncharacterised protein [Nocardia otitidiscaviarum]